MQTKYTTPLDFQERFSPFQASPANFLFNWDAQSPTYGFGPAYSPEITKLSSLSPGVAVSTLSVSPPISDTIPDISVIQEPSSRSPSLSPSTFSVSLPSGMNRNSPAESRTINQHPFTHGLKLTVSSKSFRSPSPSPLFFDSTSLRKSARLASRAAENTSHSETVERHSASNPTRKFSPKRSFDRAFSPDDSCDSPNFELDGDYTDNEGEDTHEAVVRQCTLRIKKSKKRHPKKERSRRRCSKCPETFTRSADRARHLAAIHGINPRCKNEGRCRGCSKYLSRKDSRQRHERKCADFSRLMTTSELEPN
ncbi:hypothetical protein BDZ94DRAFT_172712 [Collybia nuda]|uniref:C2H2-type domain-containing protein n=1 Tax=Collybia nuda TaxID=64659 RepID=A0A9P5YC31_9AGAR|nr:hypothetical protein BDZ94DRAFT_172712 [Collybia nuda]